ncbi:MAG: DNA repair protein RecO [Nitrospirae bacterium]|nr:DNA repair protein RecO [Nitrospirota bacterium]
MPLLKTTAITLKSRKWGEADRIVTFYTLRFGKLRGVARGARRMKSRFGSALEPFVSCDLNLFEKPNDTLHRVSQADIKETFPALREDLALMAGAARMANLVIAITADGDPAPKIFDTLLRGFRSLNEGHDPALTTLLFQIKLLGLTGFRPQTDHCAACGQDMQVRGEGTAGRFSAQAGGLVCDACTRRRSERYLFLAPGSLAFLQQALRMTPEALNRLKAGGQVRSELETAIEAYVTVVAGKRLPPVDFLAAEAVEPAYELKR